MNKNNFFLAALCLGMCAGLLLLGLWPLNFFPGNSVHWLAGRNGISFQGSGSNWQSCAGGVALSPDPLALPSQVSPRKGSVSIEIWLHPAAEPTWGIAPIVSFYDGNKNETLFVGQRKSDLLVRILILGQGGQKRYKEIGIAGALLAGKFRFVTISSDQKGSAIYLEGERIEHFPNINLIAENASITGRTIRVGNSSDARRSWFGELFGLAVYNRSLTAEKVLQNFRWWTQNAHLHPPPTQDAVVALYTFSKGSGTWAHSSARSANSLQLPSRLLFEKRTLIPLKIFWPIRNYDFSDLIVNTLGFIPFGFLFGLWLSRAKKLSPPRTCLFVILLGMAISLSIELLQSYLPTRESSQTDLICNTIGTILGAVAFRLILWQDYQTAQEVHTR